MQGVIGRADPSIRQWLIFYQQGEKSKASRRENRREALQDKIDWTVENEPGG